MSRLQLAFTMATENNKKMLDKSVTDPGFPRRGRGANLLFVKIFAKTAQNERNRIKRWGTRPQAPLGSTNANTS